ncbi:Hypothetical_protein [Hexamita inflata]|uniref:Hypothetical_protein n=1 Tax=Hexamita inflata TaxID=28002 RepID=A0AA86QVE3_9EUKA|nr:Hypothetical protein HINF_LOCUS49886 [Hexamita inflata]
MQYILECYKYYNIYQQQDHFSVDLVSSHNCSMPNNSYQLELLVSNKQYSTLFKQNVILTLNDQVLNINCLSAENYENCTKQMYTAFGQSKLLIDGEILKSYNKYRSDIVVFWAIVGVSIAVVGTFLVYCLGRNKPTKRNRILIQLPEQRYNLLDK